MRDAFGRIFSVVPQERKTGNTVEDAKFSGIHVSSNGYYGYQPLPPMEQRRDEAPEYMDVQVSDSGIQFNNFIAPEDRLSGLPEEANAVRGLTGRKRCWSGEAPITDFKKRREFEPIREIPTANRYINSRQPTHNVPDMPRCLMGHFI